MRSISNRFAVIRSATLAIGIVGCAGLAGGTLAQSGSSTAPAPAPATYKGCVQKAPGTDSTLLISTPNACARLTGKVPGDDAIGHELELTGILTPRTASSAATLQVQSVGSVGGACSNSCSLRPTGTRGLRPTQNSPNATPGTEGGTPGKVGPPE